MGGGVNGVINEKKNEATGFFRMLGPAQNADGSLNNRMEPFPLTLGHYSKESVPAEMPSPKGLYNTRTPHSLNQSCGYSHKTHPTRQPHTAGQDQHPVKMIIALIIQAQSRGVKLTGELIKAKACRFAQLPFLALSHGWLDAFKSRHMLKQ